MDFTPLPKYRRGRELVRLAIRCFQCNVSQSLRRFVVRRRGQILFDSEPDSDIVDRFFALARIRFATGRDRFQWLLFHECVKSLQGNCWCSTNSIATCCPGQCHLGDWYGNTLLVFFGEQFESRLHQLDNLRILSNATENLQ